MKRELKYKLLSIDKINNDHIKRMFILMQENYDYINQDNFNNDLLNKDYIGLLIDNKNIIQGFTTYLINPKKYFHKKYNILFSGDTVISEDFVGTQALAIGWCETVAFFIRKYPRKKLLWYLMSKGHRTYLYLPYFFKKYYPAIDKNINNNHYKEIINECSSHIFCENWNPKKGIVQFNDKVGQIKQQHIKKLYSKKNRYIDFFLEKNPGFSNGDELICMAEISSENLMRLPKLIFERSLRNQQHLDNYES